MRRTRSHVSCHAAAAVVALLALVVAGCSTDSAGAGFDAASEHATIVIGTDSSLAGDGGAGDAQTLHTSFRIALLSSLGYGIDVCVRTNASAPYIGPLLYQQLPSIPDGGADAKKDAHLAHDAHAVDAEGSKLDAARDGAMEDAESRDARGDDAMSDAKGDMLPDAKADGSRDALVDVRADSARDATAREDATRDGAPDVTPEEGGERLLEGGDGRAGSELDGATDAATDAVTLPDAGERVGGVLFSQVSSYLTVAGAGTFDVAIVLGGSPSCLTHQPLLVQRLTLDAGKLSTLVVRSAPVAPIVDAGPTDATVPRDAARADATKPDATPDATVDARPPVDASRDGANGDASDLDASAPSLSILVLTDEPAVSTALSRARFFNATTASSTSGDGGIIGALRVSAVENLATVPLASDVPVNQVSLANPSDPSVDTLGYWQGAPLVSSTPINLRVSQATGATSASDAGTDADGGGTGPPSWTFGSTTSFDLTQARSNHTGFFVGNPGPSLNLIWCDDTSSGVTAMDASTSNNQILTSCVIVTAH